MSISLTQNQTSNLQYANLSDMMRKAPLTKETVAEFRDQALLAVDGAIDVFFKPEREVAEGKAAYDKLSDVERALRSYQGRFRTESKAMEKSFRAEAATPKTAPEREELVDAPSRFQEGRG